VSFMSYAFSQSGHLFGQWHFNQIEPFEKPWLLVVLVFFYLSQWDLCFAGINVVMGQRTTVDTPTKEVNKTWLFSSFFHEKVLHMVQCGWNHLLPLGPHPSQPRSYPWCMWIGIDSTYVFVCFACVLEIKGFYMDTIGVGIHNKSKLDKNKEIRWHEPMWDSRWVGMSALDFRTLFTWIGSTKGLVHACIRTQHLLFKHGFALIILMMYFISKM